MRTRELGRSGLEVSMVGLGCMGMSDFYGPSDDAKSIATLHHALDVGMTFWDTADMYGVGANERLLAEVLLQGRHIVPIPGTRRPERVEENAAAADVALSADELALIDEVIPRDLVAGLRYPEAAMTLLNG